MFHLPFAGLSSGASRQPLQQPQAKFCSRACYQGWQKGAEGDTKRRNSLEQGPPVV